MRSLSLLSLLGALAFFPFQTIAQEAPLAKGQFETTIGVQMSKPQSLFLSDGSSQELDDSLALSNVSFLSLSLYSQITYALDRRFLLSLRGPLVRSVTLTGDNIISDEIVFSRIEQTTGPGDVSLQLAWVPSTSFFRQKGAVFSVGVPTGSDEARVALGSGFLQVQAGVFAYQVREPFFTRASLSVGNSNSFFPEVLPSLAIGRPLGRLIVEQELRGLLPVLGVSDASAESRDALTGVAPRRSSLLSVSTLRLSLGNIEPIASLQWRMAGQNEARGLSYFIGVRVAPPNRRDHSKPGVP
jgi:hypothetical protein